MLYQFFTFILDIFLGISLVNCCSCIANAPCGDHKELARSILKVAYLIDLAISVILHPQDHSIHVGITLYKGISGEQFRKTLSKSCVNTVHFCLHKNADLAFITNLD